MYLLQDKPFMPDLVLIGSRKNGLINASLCKVGYYPTQQIGFEYAVLFTFCNRMETEWLPHHRKCNKWLPEQASTFTSGVSLQCAHNTYQSIKAVIIQGTKWDRVIASVGRGRWNPASRWISTGTAGTAPSPFATQDVWLKATPAADDCFPALGCASHPAV